MIKILLDSDLVLEALINRYEFVEEVRESLDQTDPLIQLYLTDVGQQKIDAYIKCFTNHHIATIIINWLQNKIHICTINQNILQQARSSPVKDFESAVELACVSYQNLDAIITHKHENFAEAENKYRVWSITDLRIRVKLETQLRTTI